MKSGQVIVTVIVIAVIALGATVGYSISTGKTSKITENYDITKSVRSNNSSKTNSTVRSTRSFQTSYDITFTAGENITACCVSGVSSYNTTIVNNNTTISTNSVTTSVGGYTVGAQLFYPISIEYNGSWSLVYWIEYASGTNQCEGKSEWFKKLPNNHNILCS
jgi:hypothetical protein